MFLKWHKYEILSCILSYFVIYGIMMGAMFSGEQKFFWTNLRLFVKENYLRSRREQDSDTKHEKSKNDIMYLKRHKYEILSCILSYFVIYGLMMGAMISGEQNFFWTNLRLFVKENYLRSRREQDSDTKHEKSQNMILCIENDTNTRYYHIYCHIL